MRDEATEAAEGGKLVAISLDGAAPPMGFRQYHAIDFSGWKGGADTGGFGYLKRAIDAKLNGASAVRVEPAGPSRKFSAPIAAIFAAAVVVLAGCYFAFNAFVSKEAGEPAATGTSLADPPVAETQPDMSAPKTSVAVLPFATLSSGAEDGYFADGLTEEILNSLAALPDLQVTARTSSFYFKGKNLPVRKIAAELGVAHIVEGSVRRSGDKARITAQLIRAADGFQLWSQAYDRPLDDEFALQTEIAEAVAEALGVLLDDDRRRALRRAGLNDVEAFIAYQRGFALINEAHLSGNDPDLFAQANAFLDIVIERAPDFSDAYLRRADRYTHIVDTEDALMGRDRHEATGMLIADAYNAMLENYDAAVAAANNPIERLGLDMARQTVTDDWSGLSAKMDKFFSLEPGCYEIDWILQIASSFGFAQEVYDFLQYNLAACNQFDRFTPFLLADAALKLGRPEEALAIVEKAERRFADPVYTPLTKAKVLLLLNRAEEAALLEEAAPSLESIKIITNSLSGHKEEAKALYNRAHSDGPAEPVHFGDIMLAAYMGDLEEANRLAAAIDASPIGPLLLARNAWLCACGAPFDLDVAPNFRSRLEEANLPWPPDNIMNPPLKDW